MVIYGYKCMGNFGSLGPYLPTITTVSKCMVLDYSLQNQQLLHQFIMYDVKSQPLKLNCSMPALSCISGNKTRNFVL
jgi:Na+-translocating ferredoxin:NAD+ oxidoreductase RnfA subunit